MKEKAFHQLERQRLQEWKLANHISRMEEPLKQVLQLKVRRQLDLFVLG